MMIWNIFGWTFIAMIVVLAVLEWMDNDCRC